MKIIFTDSSRLGVVSCSKCKTEIKFSLKSNLYIEKTGTFLAFGLSQEKQNEPRQHQAFSVNCDSLQTARESAL